VKTLGLARAITVRIALSLTDRHLLVDDKLAFGTVDPGTGLRSASGGYRTSLVILRGSSW
jgi:hypothetical protein